MPEQSSLNETKTYTGTVEDIVFTNEENGYTVCDIASDGDYFTACGIMPYISVGEKVTVTGNWEANSSYGLQFRVDYYEDILPCDGEAMVQYLSSGNIKGVGKKTAERIVARFGSDTFDVIENHPEWLTDIKNINESKAEQISECFKATAGVRTVINFCRGAIPSSAVMRIYRKWGNASLDMIKNDPYRLCEIDGITFSHADSLAEGMGLEKNDPGRVRAGIIGFMTSNASNGHTFIPEDKVIPGVARLLEIDEGSVVPVLETLIGEKELARPIFKGARIIYLKKYFEAEKFVAKSLLAVKKNGYGISADNVASLIRNLEIRFGIDYADMQKKAIATSLSNGVMVITGGPGTGKTTIIRAIISIFDFMDMETVLCAPTGRAAKRLSEATGCEAFTIHRLLEMEFGGDGGDATFRKNENDRLEQDVIIIDETSMVDIILAQALLKAVKPGARIIFVGDSDQLPSVGAGNFLNDIIRSGCFPVIALTDIFRQDAESYIITNSHLINEGKMPKIDNKNVTDFFFMTRNSTADVSDTVVELCASRLPSTYGKQIADDLQIITPTRKGPCGTEALNAALQAALNPPKKNKAEKKRGKTVFRVGDKVMQIKNDYSAEWTRGSEYGVGIYNGDIGRITDIDLGENTLTVDFDGRVAEIGFEKLEDIEHAYAITVHKSQGNEYSTVILPLFSTGAFYSENLFTRNLLYTAVTRAKNMVIMVGSVGTVAKMVENNRQNLRFTGLPELIRYYAERD
ncbi:MAG: ATP-dependent RecD-like DNA helicase [Firmicutes bacterium]|nr:ATP-dependent RecD-like DNA helicase [Candidatus Colimorpha enterica]